MNELELQATLQKLWKEAWSDDDEVVVFEDDPDGVTALDISRIQVLEECDAMAFRAEEDKPKPYYLQKGESWKRKKKRGRNG